MHSEPSTFLRSVSLADAANLVTAFRQGLKEAGDYAAREFGRLRVARHGGKEDVKVAATLRRPHWRSEEEDEEQCGKRTLHRRSSFTIPLVPAQAAIRDVPR
jgi:hypothetical protein